MCQALEEQITAAATTAQNLLGQLGPLVWALHVARRKVIPRRFCLDLEPEEYVVVATEELPAQKAKRKDAVVEILRDLKRLSARKHPELLASPG